MDVGVSKQDASKRTCGGGACGVALSGARNGLQNFYKVANQHRPQRVVALHCSPFLFLAITIMKSLAVLSLVATLAVAQSSVSQNFRPHLTSEVLTVLFFYLIECRHEPAAMAPTHHISDGTA